MLRKIARKKVKARQLLLSLMLPFLSSVGFSQTPLTSGVAVSNLFEQTGMGQVFTIDVPENTATLNVNISGGEGDADLYVRWGQAPSLRNYDCRPYQYGNNESCQINEPKAGTYYILLQGYRAYSNVTLVAELVHQNQDEEHSKHIIYLDNAVPVHALSSLAGEVSALYRVDLPEGAEQFSVGISGGVGDADLYVRRGHAPSDTIYDCRPYMNGNRETCRFPSPQAGTYFVQLKAYRNYTDVDLVAHFTLNDSEEETPSNETDQGCTLSETDQALLDAHNVARSQGRHCGSTFYPAVAPLTWQCTLAQATKNHNVDMATNNFFSHTGSDGLSAFNRINNLGYTYQAAGENIAAGYSSVSSAMAGWLASSGHCQNIMSDAFVEMGAHGLLNATGAQYSAYWTAVFGKPQ